jgi:hypothetical protein
MDAGTATTISAIASGVSALAALIAIAAVKNTNKIARANILPFLSFEDAASNDSLKVENTGNGPVLNLRFYPLTQHYLDMDGMIEYSTQITSVPAGKSMHVNVLRKGLRAKDTLPDKGDSFDILPFAQGSCFLVNWNAAPAEHLGADHPKIKIVREPAGATISLQNLAANCYTK